MPTDLETLKTEIPQYLDSHGLIAFHGESRLDDPSLRTVMWDVDRRPDFREFLDCAQRLGVKLVVLHSRAFESQSIEDLAEELDESEIPPGDSRELERRLRKLEAYTGFTSQIEISFDYEDNIYMFEVRSDFMNEFLTIMSEIELWFSTDPDDDEDKPMSGFYSRN